MKCTTFFTISTMALLCAVNTYAQTNNANVDQRIQIRKALLGGNQQALQAELQIPFRNNSRFKTDNYKRQLTPRNTGNNELSTFYVSDVFIDSQGRYYFKSTNYGNYTLDVFDTNDNSWSHLEVGDELPATVNSFVEVSTSEVWIGTRDGLYKFNSDYVKEDSLDLNTDSMPSNRIGELIMNSNNHIWAVQKPFFVREFNSNTGGTDTVYSKGGLTLFDPTDKTIIVRSDTMSSGLDETIAKKGIRDISTNMNGDIWVATEKGVGVYASDGTSASSYTTQNSDLPSNDVLGVAVDGSGNMWVSFGDSINVLASYDGTNWTTYTTNDLPFDHCNSLSRGTGNVLYCSEESLYSYDGTNWTAMTDITVKGVPLENAASISSNNGIDIFIPNGPGAFIKEGENWDYFSTHTDNGLFSMVIFSASTDAQGGLWTSGFYGAAYFDGSDWTYYDESDGLKNRYSWKIHAASDGTVWFGTSEQISYLKDGEFHTYNEIPEYFGEDIYEDRDGNIWMGSFSSLYNEGFKGGILKYDGQDFTFFPYDTTNVQPINLSFAQGPDDMVYATTTDYSRINLIRYDGSEWSVWNPDSSITVGYTKLEVDNDNNLYFLGKDTANVHMLYKWDSHDLIEYELPEGCYSDTEAMEADSENNIWIGCSSSTVIIFNVDEESWVTHDLPVFNGIYDIKHDGNGKTWVATYVSGLFEFNTFRAVSNEEIVDATPKEFKLNQNYPNPFNPSTMIGYQLPENSRVTLKVYDILGREVATLLNANRQIAGQHQVSFDASHLASGMYIYRLSSDRSIATKKMMLIK